MKPLFVVWDSRNDEYWGDVFTDVDEAAKAVLKHCHECGYSISTDKLVICSIKPIATVELPINTYTLKPVEADDV